MKRYSAIIVTVFAIANSLFASRGGWFVFETVSNYIRVTTRSSNPIVVTHSFAVTFFIVTGINVLFLCLLIVATMLLLRFRLSGITFCIAVFVAEIVYYIGITPLAMSGISLFKDLGEVEAIGNMGLGPQILTGYPLIGLVILVLVRRNLRRIPEVKSSGVVLQSM